MDVVTLGAALNGSKAYTDQVTQSLMGGVHYRGSVSYYADLPNDAQEGDSYTVKYAGTSGSVADGTEYTWGYDTDTGDYAWISFSKDTYSKAETDALLSGKQAALSQAQLNAVNSGIDSEKVEQIETNKTNILSDKQKFQSQFYKYNCADVLQFFGDLNGKSVNGIVYSWNGDTISAKGKTTGIASYNLYFEQNAMPKEITKGEKYRIINTNTNSNIAIRIGAYYSNDWHWKDMYNNAVTEYDVPIDAVGFAVRVWIPATGVTVDTSFRLNILNTTSNKDLADLYKIGYTTETFNNNANTSTINNNGTQIRIMSYNVAHYNNDTNKYISNFDDKINNFKKMIYKSNPDIIGIQENTEFIDNTSKNYSQYLFAPSRSNSYGTSETVIVSKYTAANSGHRLLVTEGRSLRYVVYTINNNNLLFVSAHPVYNYNSTGGTSAESIAMRQTQYTDIFEWVNHEKSLRTYESATELVAAPNWDYAIITMDANSTTAEDKTNLSTIANSYNFTMANGGYVGWCITAQDKVGANKNSIDNIICSPNVVINSIDIYDDWYDYLYSDHYPLIADVTLTE